MDPMAGSLILALRNLVVPRLSPCGVLHGLAGGVFIRTDWCGVCSDVVSGPGSFDYTHMPRSCCQTTVSAAPPPPLIGDKRVIQHNAKHNLECSPYVQPRIHSGECTTWMLFPFRRSRELSRKAVAERKKQQKATSSNAVKNENSGLDDGDEGWTEEVESGPKKGRASCKGRRSRSKALTFSSAKGGRVGKNVQSCGASSTHSPAARSSSWSSSSCPPDKNEGVQNKQDIVIKLYFEVYFFSGGI